MIFEAPKANWELRFASERLLASDFEALEVSWTPRGDQESLKEVSKSSKVTIRRRRVDVRQSFWVAQNDSTSSMDGDFGALGDLLEAHLAASRCPRDLQSLKI